MDMNGLIRLCRTYLFDEGAKIWTDGELTRMLGYAADCYSRDTLAYHHEFSLVNDDEGLYHFPPDFIELEIAWNNHGDRLTVVTGRQLLSMGLDLSARGEPECIYNDLVTEGAFRLYPVPDSVYHDVIFSQEYGVLSDGYGVDTFGYGVPIGASPSDSSHGDAMYCRMAHPEEVKDYMALVYHVMSQAYSTDSEFSNPRTFDVYYGRYRDRADAFSHVMRSCTGENLCSHYY